ncbi:hypothetical protein HK097_001179 [Rhizophlyctis rosea]|uniref:Urease accessory protein UreF n=1 Tax=Rhizophlyctis rosea TaxID=64517 RepID=A0AAD5X0Y5_9FUNG|nr:hypothetical protein HK097_001179 [Rhizophlyctis rosea]
MEDWLLWMLADSSLPTGGFVASGGLEAALHASQIHSEPSLISFISTSLHNLAHSSIPYVRSAWSCLDSDSMQNSDTPPSEELLRLDKLYDALTGSNHVARRASIAQGSAYLTVMERGFVDCVEDGKIKQMKLFKMKIRGGTTPGHLPITFGAITQCLRISLDKTLHLYLYLHARTLLSSAVRLNLVGPYRAQALLLHLHSTVDKVLENYHLSVERPEDVDRVEGKGEEEDEGGWQTSPLLDIMQGTHDRLYTRLFNT